MKFLVPALCAVIALGCERTLADTWQPSPGHTQIRIWPGTPPDAKPMPGPEKAGLVGTVADKPKSAVAGKPWEWVANVTNPTMTIYAPKGKNTGAAVVVFPGGGFEVLAIDLEGTEVCDWLTAKGVTCVLLKYRVPSEPYDPKCDCNHGDDLVTSTRALEDAQRTMGLVRLHAKEWHIDPHKVGVLGFSAGGYLAAEVNTRYKKRLYAPIDDADKETARPDFAVLVYPGHLVADKKAGVVLNPNVPVTSDTPPTFLVQAENDTMDGVHQVLAYYIAAAKVGAPVEMHLYAQGWHAFGLRHTENPITDWPRLVETWLHTIGITPK